MLSILALGAAPPMNNLFSLVALLFVFSVLLPTLFRLFRSGPREARTIVDYARKRGYTLANPGIAQALHKSYLEMLKDPALRNSNSNRPSLDLSDIEKLGGGTGDWLAFNCDVASREVTIFNLSVTSQRTDGRGTSLRYKVAKAKAAGLPRFSLGKNSRLHSFENALDRMTGKARKTVTVDARLYPTFAAHFWVEGPDPAAVTEFLSGNKLRFLETANLEGILATNANYLVYFEDGILATEADFDSFIKRAESLVRNLLDNIA